MDRRDHSPQAPHHPDLVEHHGFRAIAFEDDWSLGTQLNDYALTGRGDLSALMGQLSTEARTHENAELFEYLRAYNATYRDKVRFAGSEYFSTRRLSYDADAEYVARRAPHRLAELHRSLDPIRRTSARGTATATARSAARSTTARRSAL